MPPDTGPPPISGMRATIVRLRLDGAKHKCETEEGFVVVSEVTDHRCMGYHARSQAQLYRTEDRTTGHKGPPLFDPFLLSWDERGVFVQGWEIGIGEKGESLQRAQIWQIIPLKAEANVSALVAQR